MKAKPLPSPQEEPLLSIEEAGACLGLSRSVAYRLWKSGGFPVEVLQLGDRKRYVRTVDVYQFLGLDAAS